MTSDDCSMAGDETRARDSGIEPGAPCGAKPMPEVATTDSILLSVVVSAVRSPLAEGRKRR